MMFIQICFLIFVCSDSFVQICVFRFVCSDLFLHILFFQSFVHIRSIFVHVRKCSEQKTICLQKHIYSDMFLCIIDSIFVCLDLFAHILWFTFVPSYSSLFVACSYLFVQILSYNALCLTNRS